MLTFFVHWICVDKQSLIDGTCTYVSIIITAYEVKSNLNKKYLSYFIRPFRKKCHVDDDMTLTLIKLPRSGS